MSWLIDALSGENIVWLLITTIVAIISGFLASWFTYPLKKQEIIDNAIVDIQKKQHEIVLEEEKSRDERIRQEIIRWANPILGAVGELAGRLENILEHQGYLALSKKGQWNPDWSISYDYFMSSTLYLFSQYFALVQMLKERLSFELFQSQKEKDRFFKAIRQVGGALGGFPPKYRCSGKDTQVFRLQRRAIGELLLIGEQNDMSCLRYHSFLQKLNTPEFNIRLKPLRMLLEELNPDEDCRWKRVEATLLALRQLKVICQELLHIDPFSLKE